MQACTQAGYSLSQTVRMGFKAACLYSSHYFFSCLLFFFFFPQQFNSFPKSLNWELTDLAPRSVLPWFTAWGASTLCNTNTHTKPLSTNRNCFTQTPSSPLTCCYFPTPQQGQGIHNTADFSLPIWGILPSSDYTSLKFWKITARGLSWGFLVLQKCLPVCLHAVRQMRGEGVQNTNNT